MSVKLQQRQLASRNAASGLVGDDVIVMPLNIIRAADDAVAVARPSVNNKLTYPGFLGDVGGTAERDDPRRVVDSLADGVSKLDLTAAAAVADASAAACPGDGRDSDDDNNDDQGKQLEYEEGRRRRREDGAGRTSVAAIDAGDDVEYGDEEDSSSSGNDVFSDSDNGEFHSTGSSSSDSDDSDDDCDRWHSDSKAPLSDMAEARKTRIAERSPYQRATNADSHQAAPLPQHHHLVYAQPAEVYPQVYFPQADGSQLFLPHQSTSTTFSQPSEKVSTLADPNSPHNNVFQQQQWSPGPEFQHPIGTPPSLSPPGFPAGRDGKQTLSPAACHQQQQHFAAGINVYNQQQQQPNPLLTEDEVFLATAAEECMHQLFNDSSLDFANISLPAYSGEEPAAVGPGGVRASVNVASGTGVLLHAAGQQVGHQQQQQQHPSLHLLDAQPAGMASWNGTAGSPQIAQSIFGVAQVTGGGSPVVSPHSAGPAQCDSDPGESLTEMAGRVGDARQRQHSTSRDSQLPNNIFRPALPEAGQNVFQQHIYSPGHPSINVGLSEAHNQQGLATFDYSPHSQGGMSPPQSVPDAGGSQTEAGGVFPPQTSQTVYVPYAAVRQVHHPEDDSRQQQRMFAAFTSGSFGITRSNDGRAVPAAVVLDNAPRQLSTITAISVSGGTCTQLGGQPVTSTAMTTTAAAASAVFPTAVRAEPQLPGATPVTRTGSFVGRPQLQPRGSAPKPGRRPSPKTQQRQQQQQQLPSQGSAAVSGKDEGQEADDLVRDAILEFDSYLDRAEKARMMVAVFSMPLLRIVQPAPGDNVSKFLAALKNRHVEPRLELIFANVLRLKKEGCLKFLNQPICLSSRQLDSCSTYLHIFVIDSVRSAQKMASSGGGGGGGIRSPPLPSQQQQQSERTAAAATATAFPRRTSGGGPPPRVSEPDARIFRFLLGCGADPYVGYDAFGDTLIHFMARLGDVALPFFLEVVGNPRVFKKDKFFARNYEDAGNEIRTCGKTPLMVAREADGTMSPLGYQVRTTEVQKLMNGALSL